MGLGHWQWVTHAHGSPFPPGSLVSAPGADRAWLG